MFRLLSKLYLLCLQILDNVLLFQMGHTYLARFHEFADAAEADGLQAVNRWRVEQQAEWNRVSNTVSCICSNESSTSTNTSHKIHVCTARVPRHYECGYPRDFTTRSPSRFLCVAGSSWVERLRSFHCSVLSYPGVLYFG